MDETILRQQLAATYNLVHYFGWDDLIYTHISCKIPGTDHFLINQYGMLFDEVTASSLVKVDLRGNVIGAGSINPAGYVIHSAIHGARPDVACVLHTHTDNGVAVSIDKDGLWPISQQAMLVMNKLGYHDYYGLVVESKEKPILTDSLGNNDYLILRNHGLLTVATTIPQTFMNMYKLQRACDIQVKCVKDRSIVIPQETIDYNQNAMGKLDSITHVPWNALMRIVEKKYPNYKL